MEVSCEAADDLANSVKSKRREFSQNVCSHVHTVQKISEAAESVKKADDTVSEVVEVLRSIMAHNLSRK